MRSKQSSKLLETGSLTKMLSKSIASMITQRFTIERAAQAVTGGWAAQHGKSLVRHDIQSPQDLRRIYDMPVRSETRHLSRGTLCNFYSLRFGIWVGGLI